MTKALFLGLTPTFMARNSRSWVDSGGTASQKGVWISPEIAKIRVIPIRAPMKPPLAPWEYMLCWQCNSRIYGAERTYAIVREAASRPSSDRWFPPHPIGLIHENPCLYSLQLSGVEEMGLWIDPRSALPVVSRWLPYSVPRELRSANLWRCERQHAWETVRERKIRGASWREYACKVCPARRGVKFNADELVQLVERTKFTQQQHREKA
jgi:hypothetical protein